MNHSQANILNNSFFDKMNQSFSKIPNTKNVIIKGNGMFFSSGLDLFYTNKLDREEMTSLIKKFEKILQLILNRTGKTIAFINGHAIAGGFIIASACDHVFIEKTSHNIEMNNDKLKIKLPPTAEAIIQTIFKKELSEFSNKKISIKEVCTNAHFSISKPRLRIVKKNKIKLNEIKNLSLKNNHQKIKLFLDSWFSEESLKARKSIIDQIKKIKIP